MQFSQERGSSKATAFPLDVFKNMTLINAVTK